MLRLLGSSSTSIPYVNVLPLQNCVAKVRASASLYQRGHRPRWSKRNRQASTSTTGVSQECFGKHVLPNTPKTKLDVTKCPHISNSLREECGLWLVDLENVFVGTGVPLSEGPVPYRKHRGLLARLDNHLPRRRGHVKCFMSYNEGRAVERGDAEAPQPGP